MRRVIQKILIILSIVVSSLVATSGSADMNANQSFQLGKSDGIVGKQTTSDGVNSTNATGNVPLYQANPSQSGMWNANDTLGSQGTVFTQSCQTANTSGFNGKSCDAVNFVNGTRTPYHTGSQDAAMFNNAANASSHAPSITQLSQTTPTGSCNTYTVTTPGKTVTKTCETWRGADEHQALINLIVIVSTYWYEVESGYWYYNNTTHLWEWITYTYWESYQEVTDEYQDRSACSIYDNNSECNEDVSKRICTIGHQTRIIDGLPVTRSCWQWKATFYCLNNEYKNGCADLIAEGCTVSGAAECISSTDSGLCQTWETPYSCVTPPKTEEVTDCSGVGICLYGNCFNSRSPPDRDFAAMAVTMEAAREAGVYLTPNTADPRVFHGEGNKCSIKLSGIKNCCKAEAGARSNQSLLASATMGAGRAVLDYSFQKASGYMYDFFSKGNSWLSQKAASAFSAGAAGVPAASFSLYGITISYSAGSFAFAFDPASFALQVGIYLLMQWLACDEDETYLKMKKGANLCHYIGRYCSKKFLGYCFERKESYCCFNSRLARIINDQGRPQIGKGWGTAKNPECSGFTPAEFQGLDFSAMDLSEFIDEIMASVAHPEGHVGELINKQSGIIDQKVNDYFNP